MERNKQEELGFSRHLQSHWDETDAPTKGDIIGICYGTSNQEIRKSPLKN